MEKTNDKQWTRAIAFIVLVMWMGLSSALAQSITVKGQVLDAKSKEPLRTGLINFFDHFLLKKCNFLIIQVPCQILLGFSLVFHVKILYVLSFYQAPPSCKK